MRVAVVGAGIAGAACARVLCAAGVEVMLCDRGTVPGGRLSSRPLSGRPVDLGASYLTAADPDFVAVVDDWVERGLARPWTDTFHVAGPDGLAEAKTGPMRYGSALGMRSLVEDLLGDLQVRSGHEVIRIGPGPTVLGEPYDAVVLAMPDPQAARILDSSLAEARAAVADRPWEPVLALAAGFPERGWPAEFDGCFVHDSDVLGWIADDGRRRGDGAPVLVAHSTAEFAAAHLQDPAEATGALLGATCRVLAPADGPEWPAPDWTLVQRWTFARPTGPREQRFHLDGDGIGLCGDGWGAPKVESAWVSGHQLGQALLAR